MFFLSARQAQALRTRNEIRDAEPLKYRASDPIARFQLTMDNASSPPSLADGERRLRALVSLLGKPSSKRWWDPDHTDHIYGIEAEWRLPDDRVIHFAANVDDSPLLEVVFSR